MPKKTVLERSPLNDISFDKNDYSSECDKDHESTNYSTSMKDSPHSLDINMPLTLNGVVIDNFMASDNLNECVEALLTKQKCSN